jgi:hypothetical protein
MLDTLKSILSNLNTAYFFSFSILILLTAFIELLLNIFIELLLNIFIELLLNIFIVNYFLSHFLNFIIFVIFTFYTFCHNKSSTIKISLNFYRRNLQYQNQEILLVGNKQNYRCKQSSPQVITLSSSTYIALTLKHDQLNLYPCQNHERIQL